MGLFHKKPKKEKNKLQKDTVDYNAKKKQEEIPNYKKWIFRRARGKQANNLFEEPSKRV